MRPILLWISLLFTFLTSPLTFAQISIWGPLSGTFQDTSYYVIDDISVAEGDFLTIEAGATFFFLGDFRFEIRGYLEVLGTEGDSVYFKSNTGLPGWQGIDFGPTSVDTSRLEYCVITNSQSSGIYLYASDPTISHCRISDNLDDTYGGGINCAWSSNPTISSCRISHNSAYYGGGIYAYHYSDPLIEDCEIDSNCAEYGGGISLVRFSDATVIDCDIKRNEADEDGGGIYLQEHCTGLISQCTFSENDGYFGTISCEFNSSPTIEECTFSDNSSTWNGGVWCRNHSHPLITHCTFQRNSGGRGGGVYTMYSSNPVIEYCLFEENYDYQVDEGGGGGLYAYAESSPVVRHCVFRNNSINSASRQGGAIHLNEAAFVEISNCLIYGNYASTGGGIYSYHSNARIVNCTIAYNLTGGNSGGGINCGSAYDTEIVNCIIAGNFPDDIAGSPDKTYTNVPGEWSGTGNIGSDPLFADPANGDYHLQSEEGTYQNGSWVIYPQSCACIDAGDPAYVYDQEPEPNGFRINMGAYGNTPEASKTYVPQVVRPRTNLPVTTGLSPAFPNPFNPETVIRCELSVGSRINCTVYDNQGSKVAHLVDGWREAGRHEVTFDGSGLPSGVYFVQFEAGGYRQAQSIFLIK